MLSGFTKDAEDIQTWAENYYSSLFHEGDVDLRVVAREYIETRLSQTLDWKVIKHESHPEYTLRVRKAPSADPSDKASSNGSLKLDVVTQYSGYLSFEDKHLYFYFFESRNNPLKDPLILWLNGGPGCSSFFGLLFALGPSLFKESTSEVYYNPWSWNHRTSIIFLDQPADTGFSYSSEHDVSTILHVSWNLYLFMVLFFNAFPQYSELDFHLAGESFAGRYISAFASTVTYLNDDPLELDDIPVNITKIPKINLKSVMIGNGYVDPYNQAPFYYYVGCLSSWGRLLPKEDCLSMRRSVDSCRRLTDFCNSAWGCDCTCSSAYGLCQRYLLTPFVNKNISLYDRRLTLLSYSDIDENGNFSVFMNKHKDFFNATSAFYPCNFNVTSRFFNKGELSLSSVSYLKSLLEADLKVLIFAGDQDVICNWYGVSAWVHAMKWDGSEAFNKLDFRTWRLSRKLGNKLKGTVAGQVKHHDGLTLLRVRDAGHAVGETQPEYNFEMYLRWLEGDYAFEKN
ncbi:hypothetical protein MERGE_000822 [Pneumocystis wakefieldiae]|uniref:carboxypeptidase C n=1 Tax=Pneumocystis wakefieldiae TaxID=38082 RepID=A0A899G2Q7_9ASCO|nr:hypothetical protein MERGE_000822 [Pneumocystis wakefieldiae]